MPESLRTRTPVWKKRRVVKTGRPTQRSSPTAIAMMSDENDISETSKSPNFNCRQNSSDACTGLGMSSMPSGLMRPSWIAHVLGLDAMPMLS